MHFHNRVLLAQKLEREVFPGQASPCLLHNAIAKWPHLPQLMGQFSAARCHYENDHLFSKLNHSAR